MLIKYKSSWKKIAMGLISFMPGEKDIKKLQETIERYEQDSNWDLYLWKQEDIVGIIGIRLLNDGKAELCHLSVNPSFRHEGIGKKMVDAVKRVTKSELIPNENTKDFFITCEMKE
ncbi:GNAT family N-acetyltransferase [Alkalihalobacterium bogoriense]|uniref:GNAT family N-acetyltransferase n=1 Tax=Alkalihalobacterium bogoriense TaxID=246272 RepID=UPI00047E12DD|nr:GNAT family N-acetyltransferase [Alkalihalobacterium bogoriense]